MMMFLFSPVTAVHCNSYSHQSQLFIAMTSADLFDGHVFPSNLGRRETQIQSIPAGDGRSYQDASEDLEA